MIRRYPELSIAIVLILVLLVCGLIAYDHDSGLCHAAGGTLTGYRDELCVDKTGRIITDW